VYDAIDMTWLKRAMDMSMDAWAKPKLKTRETEKLIDWLLRLSKNAMATFSKGKDSYAAAVVVKEKLLAHPEVKAVVYSGNKTSLAQVDSMRRLMAPKGVTNGGAGYRLVGNGTTTDSLWQENYYDKDGKLLGRVTARPPRR
jgi:hypothetical protein